MTIADDGALALKPRSRWLDLRLLKNRPGSGTAPRQKRNLNLMLREWHRRAGLFAFVFLAWLGTSGILINQSASWGYDTQRIDWSWVMALYGLHAEAPRKGYAAGGHWVARTSDHLLLDARPLAGAPLDPLGAVVATDARGQERVYIASADRLIVLDESGRLVDSLSAPILPVHNIRRLGSVEQLPDSVVVQDLDAFVSRDGGESWAPVAAAEVHWSTLTPIPETHREQLLPYSRPSVTLEHVLVDAHSGRLFGSAGAWVINAAGLAALALGISGIWMMWRTRRRSR